MDHPPGSLVSLTEHDVPVPMRDGAILRAIVTRPADGRPAPVVLVRTPYPLAESRAEIDAIGVAQRGLVLVLQSVRGTGRSDGEFSPWIHEAEDGFDSIAWCSALPWSDGNVATLGRSYLAQAQVLAAGERPAALRAMALDVVGDDPYEVQWRNGALGLGASLGWSVAMAGISLERAEARGEDVRAERSVWLAAMNDMPAVYRRTPLADFGGLERHMPGWLDLLAHPTRDAWWQAAVPPEREPLPTIIVAGWHDLFIAGSLRQFAIAARNAASRLIVGPWSHTSAQSALGDVYYGAMASAAAQGLDARRLDFLDAHLRGADTGRGGVHLFVMGANQWRDFDSWPPAPSRDLELFLRPGGRLAEGPAGAAADGGEVQPSTFVFDPRDPVPTVGGANLMAWADAMDGSGACDQRQLDGRADILRFATEPLGDAFEVIGSVRLTLFAATSAVDTDWTGKLVDVYPDGRAFNVVDSIVRARLRDASHEAPLQPDRPHEFTFELGPTAQRFAAGHRIRLDISSSNFPRFDRNPGTGGSSATAPEATFISARQSVFHDAAHPSRLTLPVFEG